MWLGDYNKRKVAELALQHISHTPHPGDEVANIYIVQSVSWIRNEESDT